ncbi:hypothetical protein M501DRAFT_1011710 [Patellaria atrata CBS 101060]|uniref:Uncharacterized protein n=1 Tax=Patellaria atrata CBS 101060 TaxID=1346257 RepID=A0A9P4VS01_9PEZI|nr:hypothetical protein M501DRAFT_1011710 [Patellaria atrata CBS 101060]
MYRDSAGSRSASPSPPPRSRREEYYNQQRSSLRSSSIGSGSPPPRTQSRQYDPPSDFDLLHDAGSTEAPGDPYELPLQGSLEEEKRRKSSRKHVKSPVKQHSSPGTKHSSGLSGTTQQASRRSRTSEYAIPPRFENLDEVAEPETAYRTNRHGPYKPIKEKREERMGVVTSSPGRTPKSTPPRKHPRKYSHREEDITALPVAPSPEVHRYIPRESGHPASSDKAAQSTYKETRSAEGDRKVSRLATEIYTISYLVFFSILGTLARLGVEWLTLYPGAPTIESVLWANFGGSLVLGFLAEDRQLFKNERGLLNTNDILHGPKPTAEDIAQEKAAHTKVKKTIPLYIGLATGFCGSFTSFSSFMRDVFLTISNELPTPLHSHPSSSNPYITPPRNWAYSIPAVLGLLLLQLSLPLTAFRLGTHTALFLDRKTPTLPPRLVHKFLDRLILLLGPATWLAAAIITALPPDRNEARETWRGKALFASVLAPPGCLLRFYLALHLNALTPSFPLGTFAANVFGTAVLGMSWDLQHSSLAGSAVGGGRGGCQVLQGVMEGFCGALTTVSTFVAELGALRRVQAYVYAGVSVGVGMAVVLVVMGVIDLFNRIPLRLIPLLQLRDLDLLAEFLEIALSARVAGCFLARGLVDQFLLYLPHVLVALDHFGEVVCRAGEGEVFGF